MLRPFIPARLSSRWALRWHPIRRWNSSKLSETATESAAESRTRARIERVNARLPKFLRRYTTALANAPVSHISAFLILHELTAIVPLVGLAATFHYTGWLPPFLTEGAWVSAGVEKFGRYFKKKGWINDVDIETEGAPGRVDRAWNYGEGGVKIVVETAAAWAVVKALLPLRLILSVYGTPWFARYTVVPFSRWIRAAFSRGGATKSVNVAETGATAGRVLPTRKAS